MNNRNETKEFLDEVAKYIFLNIKYNNTEPNKNIHKAFTQFCWDNTDGNYLQGIRLLLDNYSLDFKYESLYMEIQNLKSSLIELTEQLQNKPEEKKEKIKFFGDRD